MYYNPVMAKPKRGYLVAAAVIDLVSAVYYLLFGLIFMCIMLFDRYYYSELVGPIFGILFFLGLGAAFLIFGIRQVLYIPKRGQDYRSRMGAVLGFAITKIVFDVIIFIIFVATLVPLFLLSFCAVTVSVVFGFLASSQGKAELDPQQAPPMGGAQVPPMGSPVSALGPRNGNMPVGTPNFGMPPSPPARPAPFGGPQAGSVYAQRRREANAADTFDVKVEKLTKLQNLRTAGAVTEEEFLRMKAELIGDLSQPAAEGTGRAESPVSQVPAQVTSVTEPPATESPAPEEASSEESRT